jgi:hypothetical protein
MKVLYIGHHHEGSAWSRASIEYCLALDSIGVEVVPRTVKLGGQCKELPERFRELEARNARGCDVVIQHVLPHFFVYDGKYKKNIGMFASETTKLGLGWENYCNIMDHIIVFNDFSYKTCIDSNVNIPISVIGHPVDIEKYNRPRKKIELGPDFLFYGIGDIGARKNWGSLIRVFHSTFDPSEPVSLVLKVNSPGMSSHDTVNIVNNMINTIKMDMRMYPKLTDYKGDIIISDYLSEDELLDLHYTCDCLCSTSHGEGFSFPILDAVGFGKQVIAPSNACPNSMSTSINKINISYSPVTGVRNTLDGLFTAHESWGSPDLDDFGAMMRAVYELNFNTYYRNNVANEAKKNIEKFSYKSIGTKLLEIITNG